ASGAGAPSRAGETTDRGPAARPRPGRRAAGSIRSRRPPRGRAPARAKRLRAGTAPGGAAPTRGPPAAGTSAAPRTPAHVRPATRPVATLGGEALGSDSPCLGELAREGLEADGEGELHDLGLREVLPQVSEAVFRHLEIVAGDALAEGEGGALPLRVAVALPI